LNGEDSESSHGRAAPNNQFQDRLNQVKNVFSAIKRNLEDRHQHTSSLDVTEQSLQ